jgi:hypothetical protein
MSEGAVTGTAESRKAVVKEDKGTIIPHDARVAAYADREVVVRDGKVTRLNGAQP